MAGNRNATLKALKNKNNATFKAHVQRDVLRFCLAATCTALGGYSVGFYGAMAGAFAVLAAEKAFLPKLPAMQRGGNSASGMIEACMNDTCFQMPSKHQAFLDELMDRLQKGEAESTVLSFVNAYVAEKGPAKAGGRRGRRSTRRAN